MRNLITICARGGSKGIPGKNIKKINGKPLIGYTIDCALKFAKKNKAKVALSTDCEQIKKVAEDCGLKTDYIRPDYLATDICGKLDVLKDLLYYEEKLANNKYDYLLDLDVTSPLRTIEDIEISFEYLKAQPNALNLFSVNLASRNPYFNMVEKKNNGYFNLVKENSNGNVLTRQSAPKVYELNASFYWYCRHFFETNNKTVISDESLIYEMPHVCFDLDHMIDFHFLEYLISTNNLGFNL